MVAGAGTAQGRLMDVRYSAEQQALRDSAARIVDQLAPHAVAEIADLERSAKLDAAVAASGWRELRSATAEGAPLASGVEAAIVAEELGRGVADVPFLGPLMASELRRLTQAPSNTANETVALVADLSSAPCLVDGVSQPMVAIDAAGASTALVLLRVGDGLRLAEIAVPSGLGGVDPTRPSVTLDPDAEVTVIDAATRSMTSEDLDRWTSLGLALACADQVGAMSGAVELARTYARERQQYGVAIGSFQSIQHLLADAYVQTEGARSVTLHAAWAVDELTPPEALAAASVASAYCARAARSVCETAIQVHGGIGNTWECSAHLFLRRALFSADLLGNAGTSIGRVLASNGIGSGDGLS
jgi:alkylation response protein AidB-like acyl-CoA dehydrogenase